MISHLSANISILLSGFDIAIRKHICSDKALTRACKAICVDEPMVYWVVISALEVIEPRFGVVIVATVTQWVDRCKIRGQSEDGSISCTLRQLQYRPLIVRKFYYAYIILVQHPLIFLQVQLSNMIRNAVFFVCTPNNDWPFACRIQNQSTGA